MVYKYVTRLLMQHNLFYKEESKSDWKEIND